MEIKKHLTKAAILGAIVLGCLLVGPAVEDAEAGYRNRQYYSSWSYRPARRYNYSTYYYKPSTTYSSYSYHYCIHYPSRPRYVYYYNPHTSRYWGRFDLEAKDGKQYSMLAKEDRKEKLEDIPEEAFPEPAAMPDIPESDDGVAMAAPNPVPGDDLPSDE